MLVGFAGFVVLIGFVSLRLKGEGNLLVGLSDVAMAQTLSGAPAARGAQIRLAAAPAPQPTAVRPAAGPPVPVPQRASLAPSRPDPFRPIYLPTPPPEFAPTPVPPPLEIPAPPPVALPSRSPAGAPPSTVLVGLPSPRISRYNPLPGPRWVIPVTGKSENLAGRSSDKRLSGVIIGDSVRALLEIQQAGAGGGEGGGEGGGAGAAQVVTRVVQPGDEVDGIKILRINREFENGRPVTRMYILEGDQERYVDLRPSPSPPVSGTGGLDAEGGSSSSSGSGRSSGRGGSSSSGFGGTPPGGSGFGRGGGTRPTF